MSLRGEDGDCGLAPTVTTLPLPRRIELPPGGEPSGDVLGCTAGRLSSEALACGAR